MKKIQLTCFKPYDVRGVLGQDIDGKIFYRISRAVAIVLEAQRIVVGYDARESSPSLARSIISGLLDEGIEVLNLGMCGTEEMYWATTEFKASGGIEITASHNPVNYNGLKIVKSGSRPLKENIDWSRIKSLAENNKFKRLVKKGIEKDISKEARRKYVRKVLSFIDITDIKPLTVVVNSGNGSAGPAFDAIEKKLLEKVNSLRFEKILHQPDGSFPNGVPNPILPENWATTRQKVLEINADLGVAFDGDFDRCFFFDDKGRFVSGEYIVGLLADLFLIKEPKGVILYEPRVVWNIQDIIEKRGGVGVLSKTGHSFIKQAMRDNNAIYGGELSAHHYFRDFAFCDSGMITFLLVIELLAKSRKPLSKIIDNRSEDFISSGEINLTISNHVQSLNKVFNYYEKKALDVNLLDGLSMTFKDWRFNLRSSNTEPLVRLNIESKGKMPLLKRKLKEISQILTC